MRPFPSHGLYAITQPDGKTIEQILAEVEAVLRGGVCAVQYRDKNPLHADKIAQALLVLCHRYDVPLIINDDIELARQVQADGVHLGKDDGEVQVARERLGDNAIIGVSCYNSLDKALAAQEQGASYVAFGRFFPSNSKPLASPADIAILTAAKQVIKIPIVAIGGILPENGGQLRAAGADVLAVIDALFDNDDPEQSALTFRPLFGL